MSRGVPSSSLGTFTFLAFLPCSYMADDTPMQSYMNAHTVLNNQRQEALKTGKPGPHCIILGPTDSGKSSLAKMLCNWAARSSWQPTMVDLDIGEDSNS